jgi:hypothetical protein
MAGLAARAGRPSGGLEPAGFIPVDDVAVVCGGTVAVGVLDGGLRCRCQLAGLLRPDGAAASAAFLLGQRMHQAAARAPSLPMSGAGQGAQGTAPTHARTRRIDWPPGLPCAFHHSASS